MASIAADTEIADFESVPNKVRRNEDGFEVIRCPQCRYLHTVSIRHARRGTICRPCSHGHAPEAIEPYYAFWLERFSRQELREMALAIWGWVPTRD